MSKYNYRSESCHQCKGWVNAGEGMWFWADGQGRTFCVPCGSARLHNRSIGRKRRAEQNKQPTLFD
jgi:hypothetical protein